MAVSENDQRVLRALAEARESHGELATLLDFYYDLYQIQFQAKASLTQPEVRDELAMRWRLEGGIPQLTFDQLRLEPEPFAQLADKITQIFVQHNPEWHIEPDESSPEALVAVAQEVFETWDALTVPGAEGEDTDGTQPGSLRAMAVGFALAPTLQRAAESIHPRLDLTLWTKGYCPICGGRPNFAFLKEESGAMELMCSRCTAQWGHSRLKCPFCDTNEHPMYFASEDDVHRLYVCQACKHYVKTVDLRKARRVVYPMVERLLTIGMDLAAQQEGYRG